MATKYNGFTTKTYGRCDYVPGVSASGNQGSGTITNFKITDINTVKRDLLNHVFTRRGERVMMPTFGTIIHDLLFEPLDEVTISLIEEEIVRIVNYDPRVSLNSINTAPNYDTNSVTVSVSLTYIELNVTQNLDINIEFQ